MHPIKTVDVLGITFPILNYGQTLEIFQDWVTSKVAHQVCIANVHTVVTCLSDKELRDINNASLVTMDGLPLAWYANLVHDAGITSRVCGPDLMLKCLDQGREKGWKHFFLGGKQQVLDDLVDAMRKRYPGVEIVGWHSPPFRPLSDAEDQQLVDLINGASPDFLWVGLGAPKQEKWIAAHLDRVRAPVQLGVGAAFDFHSGHVRRAPDWMQKSGLEWLYRMFKDKRLIKRYFTTNPVFLSLFARDVFLIRLLKRKAA
ncbi:MAG: WecB/TagA/CpsF family glycosyltransferase [Methylococcaceae bacterium]|nr:WecB/TagA/CpsF family glycosyltransferase [Methylococcaceae bacterium]